MATTTRSRSRAKAKAAPPALTEYVVLEQVQGRVEPVESAGDVVDAEITETMWLPVRELVGEAPAFWQAKVFRAPSKQAAIRQHTGDGADVIEGTWKAVPVSSWKGGETTKRVTASARLPLED